MDSISLLKIHAADNVAVALKDLTPGTICCLDGQELKITSQIPKAHKAAAIPIAKGETVIKYGRPIGTATEDIPAGSHVHTHNLSTGLEGLLEYEYHPQRKPSEPACPSLPNTFMGYLRPDGRAGTRNEVWIIPTVTCVNQTARILAEQAQKRFGSRVDGIFCFPHNSGCSQLGQDHLTTQKILKGLINHPNAGAVLVVSLGCENNNLESFLPILGPIDRERVKFIVTQEQEDEYGEGLRILDELTRYASRFQRRELPVEKLQIGFKCGSSDAFSGISANPLCGRISDLIIGKGGSCVLTEVPEMFGAEQELMNRAVDEEVFCQTVALINDFKSYFMRYNQPIYENPCPGNKKGGITTLEEKSLGCIQKGGASPVSGVLSYGDPIARKGLNLLTGSGNDAVSCTNLTASGCNLLLFTTGNGNPYGSPVPTIKISSNTGLAFRKKEWIDFNAGTVLEGASFEQERNRLYHFLLDTASGRLRTKSEEHGYREISIFKDGILM